VNKLMSLPINIKKENGLSGGRRQSPIEPSLIKMAPR
jgi:hypothetical protein